MYILQFKQNRSKNFPEALALAKEFNATFENGIVTIKIENILSAYAEIRTLFSFIQNWKGTTASYNGKPVHPYQFILQAHWIGDCYEDRLIDANCGIGWECIKLNNIKYNVPERFYSSHRYWYQYGYFKGYNWIIDKPKLEQTLLNYASEKAIDLCPFFDETKLKLIVKNLPEKIIPDNITFEIVYKEAYKQGVLTQIPHSIKHLEKIRENPLRISM